MKNQNQPKGLIERPNAPSIRCSIPKEKCPTTTEPMPTARDLRGQTVSLWTGLDGGLVKMAVKPGSGVGLRPGKHGCVRMSTGNWLEIKIEQDETGLVAVPPLKGRDWHLIDVEIDSEKYDNARNVTIAPEQEAYWAKVLLQGSAALEPCPFEHILTHLTRLKLQKPTQAMDEFAVAVFLEDISEHLERREYCYHAIEQGIINLIEREDDKFFPTMKVLLRYIHPIHWKLSKRISKIEEILKRNINKI